MPYDVPNESSCKRCAYGTCVSYIREQSKRMKDRDTLYRIAQAVGMSCSFDAWIPGFNSEAPATTRLIDYAERVVANAKKAGAILEKMSPNHFGNVEAPFIITAGQSGKVRGDVFEMLCRAILWNCATAVRRERHRPPAGFILPAALRGPAIKRKLALLTLGDNYDLKKLLEPKSRKRLREFEQSLHARGTSVSYSTPDVVCVDITELPDSEKSTFDGFITTLDPGNQRKLSMARQMLENKVRAADLLFAAGIKTSLRSDRMYQFLYEANSWKFLWARAFGIPPPNYYVLTSQVFGADPAKLSSVDFSSMVGGPGQARRAIDGVFQLKSVDDLISWFVTSAQAVDTAAAA